MKDKLNIPPFYIGQKVVAIKDHTQGYFNKGDEFVVKGIEKTCCVWVIIIGVRTGWNISICVCRKSINNPNDMGRFNVASFAPLQQQSYPLMTFSKIVEKEKEEILINN